MSPTDHSNNDDGWTYVVKSKKSRPPTSLPFQYHAHANNEVVDSGAVTALHKKLQRFVKEWADNADARRLASILDQTFMFEPTLSINKIVCIALGSPDSGNLSTWKQLGCLMHLRASYFPDAKVIFQDPVFNQIDMSFFDELGIITMDTPQAFQAIDTQTFLFAPHCEHEQFCEALDGRELPGVCITNDAKQYLRDYDIKHGSGSGAKSEKLKVACKIEKCMRKMEFPGSEKLEWSHTVIYALRSEDEDEDEDEDG